MCGVVSVHFLIDEKISQQNRSFFFFEFTVIENSRSECRFYYFVCIFSYFILFLAN